MQADQVEAGRTLAKFCGAVSDILFAVRWFLIAACILLASGASAFLAAPAPPARRQNPASSQAAQPASPPAPSPTLRTVVVDPAHGGLDTGARGANGVAEKDIVLDYARVVAASLRAQGFQVILTRNGDTDPSFNDRAALANAQSGAIFISLHAASTGPIGTARTYTYLFPSPQSASSTPLPPKGALLASAPSTAAPPKGFLPWQTAQEPYLAQSRSLANLIQVSLAQKFPGSPDISTSVPVYGLRSVTAPAVAVEVSSVAANPQQLEAMASPLAEAITHAVLAYKAIYPVGGK